MLGIPRWLTSIAALFCYVFAAGSFLFNGVTDELLVFVAVGTLFAIASFMRESWLRDLLVWLGSK